MGIEFVAIDQRILRELNVVHHTGEVNEVLKEFGLNSAVQEELWVVLLDGTRNIRKVFPVAKGGYHDCDVSIPAILSPVFMGATDRFLVAHNHPSGDVAPTQHDLDLTWRLSAASDLLDLMFEDHVIVTPKGDWYSMRGHKQLRPGRGSKVSS
jgi:DNA repair protein RadC